MRAYYASPLSPNIGKTPDDYLICHNVPISRTGTQDYFGEELGMEDRRGQIVTVNRQPEDVFEPAALASFEGKPVTDEHPDESVTSQNVSQYLRGVATNIRRGEGGDSDKVLADLIIYDKTLADEIQGGKREISCGYDCAYRIGEDGTVYQCQIRGNHVAVVPAGRAGSAVAIKDSTPKQINITPERSTRKMSKTKNTGKGSIFGKLFPLFAKDADPGDVQEAIETIEEALEASPAPTDAEPASAAQPTAPPAEPAKDEDIPQWAQALAEQVAALNAKLNAPQDEDPIKKLEDELTGEAAVAKPAEQIGDGEPDKPCKDEAEPTATDGDIDPAKDADPEASANDSLLKLIRAVKPAIAGMKDQKARKAATDALTQSVNALRGTPRKGMNGYSGALDALTAAAKQRVTDAVGGTFDFDKQQSAYDKLNPHKRKEV